MKQQMLLLIFFSFVFLVVGTVTWRRAFVYPQGETRMLTRIGAIGFFGAALAFAVAFAITVM